MVCLPSQPSLPTKALSTIVLAGSGTCPKSTAGSTEQRHSVKLNVLSSLIHVDLGFKKKGTARGNIPYGFPSLNSKSTESGASEEVTAPGGDKALQKNY